MSFEELMGTPTVPGLPEGVHDVKGYTQAWQPSVEREPDRAVIITEARIAPWEEGDYERVIREHGYDPAYWRIKNDEVGSRTWDGLISKRDAEGKRYSEPVKLFSSRLTIVPRGQRVDMAELMQVIEGKAPAIPERGVSGGTFGIALGDAQLGKLESPTEGTIERIKASITEALGRFRDSGCQDIHVAWLGDEMEGFVSQGGRNAWRTTLTLTEQTRLVRRIMLWVIDACLDAGARNVGVSAVPSNHCQSIRQPVSTRPDDDYSVDSAVAVADAMLLNPERYGNVRTYVPGADEMEVTLEIEGMVVGMLHGHSVPGYGAPKAVFNWLAGQLLGGNEVGRAQLLLSGHGHRMLVADRSKVTWAMAPALELRSNWWRERSGDIGSPGLLVFIIREGRLDMLTKISAPE